MAAITTTGDCSSLGAATASYTASNKVSFVSQAAPISYSAPSGFTYDAGGNVLADGQNSYLYDGEGRLCAVKSLGGEMTAYLYDAEGLRVAKGTITTLSCNLASNGFTLTNQYLLDQSGDQVTELDGSGNWKHSNVWAGAHLDATYDQPASGVPAAHFHLADPLGTRRIQANYLGVVEMNYQSLPFGDALNSTPNPNCAAANHCYTDDPTEHHFTAKERDGTAMTESGNDYFEARYYNSSVGRFLSPDPLLSSGHPGNPQAWNRYAYAGNNPLRNVDPTGLYNMVNDCHTGDQDCVVAYAQAVGDVRNAYSATQGAYDKAVKGGDDKAAAALKRTLDGLGAEGQKNARGQTVNISVNLQLDSPGQTTFAKGSTSTINIELNPGKFDEEGDRQADIVHEGVHAGEIMPGKPTFDQAMSEEHDAYETESYFSQSIGIYDAKLPSGSGSGVVTPNVLWNPSWATADAATVSARRARGIDGAAKDGTANDCQNGGCKP